MLIESLKRNKIRRKMTTYISKHNYDEQFVQGLESHVGHWHNADSINLNECSSVSYRGLLEIKQHSDPLIQAEYDVDIRSRTDG